MTSADERRVVRQTPMRRAIGQAMVLSHRDVPDFIVSLEVEVDALVARVADARRNGSANTTVTAYLVAALARALVRHPEFNAVWDGDQLEQWSRVNIGIAIATEGGLVAPALLDCASRGVEDVASGLADLVARARAGSLRADELSEATFTLSNLGVYQVTAFAGIVVPPQVAILATGRATERPVVRDGQITIRRILIATLAADHRVVDGAAAAAFLGTFKDLIEGPGNW